MTGQQGMFTTPRHLIPLLLVAEVNDYSTSILFSGCLGLTIVGYLPILIRLDFNQPISDEDEINENKTGSKFAL